MAREFRMGARIDMVDGFSDPVSRMTRTTRQFGDTARQGSRSVDNMGRSAMSSTTGLGAFTAGSRAASLSVRGLAGGVASLTASLMGLSSVLGIVMGMLTAVSLYNWLIESNAQMEQYKNTLSVVLKSSERAAEVLEWAAKFAADTPFEIPQIVEATTRLESYGITAQKTLGTIGDMASVMGKPLMQAVEAVADAQTGEVERLKEFGITKDMLAAQSEKMGTSAINSKGQISDMQAFNAALFTIMEERYKDGMKLQSKTFKGMLSNAADFIGTMGREFGKPLFERMRTGLAGTLDFLDKIQEDGTMEAITAKAQAFGIAFADVFAWGFSFVGRVITAISDEVKNFMTANAARFTLIGTVISDAFNLISMYATPILNWLIDTALPATLTGLSLLGTAVLAVAEFFIAYWQPIAPFVQGIGIALGVILGPGYAIVSMMYLAAQAAKVWAIAQGALNLVMMANPTYLLVAGIGLLIGAGLWLVQNWAMVGQFFGTLWTNVVAGFTMAFTWIGQGVSSTLTEVAQFFANLIPQALTWGATLIRTFVDGILSMKSYLVDSVTGVFGAVRKLMPFSDAKEGPFSQLTYSGGAIMSTMAQGVRANTGTLHGAMGDAFSAAPSMGVGRASVTAAGVDGSIPISASAAAQVAGGSSTQIGTLIGQLTISGVDKNTRQIAEEVIDILHEELSGANDIMTADMGALL
ncbi:MULTISPECIES: tape measure protein [Pelosinus]|uniref:Tape measure protein N-terminal domain-containing protein n=1 Tax=Pelosinus fermentans B4 TaxID=1149862 RepID=I8RM95_9FIRM|nr:MULTISPECIES: tape measure protein [Pelosinus]EIW19910.1 hypothetical protein FB4_0161 [Pelosinus fermentans B4]EIW21233.1 hypothetical protein FA11_0960 [Pelosinus fermentans A11]